jgi:FMN phosphatase YigB (HAD superfamily)
VPTVPVVALLFDFDGTLFVGDLPTLAFARHCGEQLPGAAAVALIDGIRYFLEGKSTGARRHHPGAARDGNEAVDVLAAAAGLRTEQIRRAYRLSRRDMAGSAFTLEAPPGLPEVLADVAAAYVAVMTDADDIGVAEVLTATGVAEYVDEVFFDAGKPGARSAVIESVLSRIGATNAPDCLLVAGDRWATELAPAHSRGAATALVDRFHRGEGSPTFRAPDLAGLLPEIRSWAWERIRFGAD